MTIASFAESARAGSGTHRRAPGPRGLSAAWNLVSFYRDTTGFLERLSRDYGDVVQFRLGPRRAFLITHPDDVRDLLVTRQASFVKGKSIERARDFLGDGLLTSEGSAHLERRRLAQPAFLRERVSALKPMIVERTLRMTEAWTPGSTVEISAAMMHLSMEITARALFDTDVDPEAIARELAEILRVFPILTLPGAKGLENLPLPAFRRYHEARARLDGIVMEIIRERRRRNVDRGDFLSTLLAGPAAAGCPGHGGSAAPLTDTAIRDEMITAFLAGHETTAIALAWTFHLLSQNPEADAALRAATDRDEAARRVFAESMRLYPPIGRIGRRALCDVEIGGYAVPKDSIVFASPWVTQRDPRFFPDPLRFDPGRWTHEAESERHRFSCFPFGGGVRQCIGEPLAWTVGATVIATIAANWRLTLEPGHRVEIQPLMTLRPRNGLPMRVERCGEVCSPERERLVPERVFTTQGIARFDQKSHPISMTGGKPC